ncbi:metal transporter Nramp2-like [Camellia sinensis]|uniref:metal transporter Nramp2-like n=1 Tax=Camellia sinensis TaxID=4442 RepID=UPI0010363F91|nr:metal transporter Nramp2-like [Camellia sinensis]
MWATMMGLPIQLLSTRIGLARGRHLAELCREEYPYWAGLLLWFMSELALIGANIQEVIGSAIAIKILSNGFFPIWAGIVITASDCFIFLFLENYGVRKLEAVFAVLISTMALSFAWMFADAKPNGKELIVGLLVPKLSSKTVRQAIGVVGCVIMPHNGKNGRAFLFSHAMNIVAGPKELMYIDLALLQCWFYRSVLEEVWSHKISIVTL